MYQYEDSGRHSEGEGAYFISSAKGISIGSWEKMGAEGRQSFASNNRIFEISRRMSVGGNNEG